MSYQTRVRDALTSREQSPDVCLVETALSWIFSLSFFSGLVNQSLTLPCVKYVSLRPLWFWSKFVFRGMDLRQVPSISAFLHQLAALVLDLRTEIAWGFEEAQQAGFLSSLRGPKPCGEGSAVQVLHRAAQLELFGFFCAKFLSLSSELLFKLRSLAFNFGRLIA